eukprot:427173_1
MNLIQLLNSIPNPSAPLQYGTGLLPSTYPVFVNNPTPSQTAQTPSIIILPLNQLQGNTYPNDQNAVNTNNNLLFQGHDHNPIRNATLNIPYHPTSTKALNTIQSQPISPTVSTSVASITAPNTLPSSQESDSVSPPHTNAHYLRRRLGREHSNSEYKLRKTKTLHSETSNKVPKHSSAMKYGYKCNVCFKSFSSKRDMAQHKRIHNAERPYVCTICNTSYRSLNGQKYHMKKEHPMVWETIKHRFNSNSK